MYRDDKMRAEMAIQQINDEALAELTGLARQTISLYRKGEIRDPRVSTLTAIATGLGKDLLWILEPRHEQIHETAPART